MSRSKFLPLVLATLGMAAAPLIAQTADQPGPPAPPPDSSSYTQPQAAPIQRNTPSDDRGAYGNYEGPGAYRGPGAYAGLRPTGPRPEREMQANLTVGQPLITKGAIASARPARGIFLRAGRNTTMQAVALDPRQIELRVEHGVVNVIVRHPADDALILVDLPGGQVDLIKDGFYTINATTNTARVLNGEADAFAGSSSDGKPLKVKEGHAVVFSGASLRSVEFGPQQARADVLPGAFRPGAEMGFAGGYGEGFYGEPYGYGYDYPYYAYGYPYGFGYPFGFGLGYGLGYGYGFRGYGYGGYGGFRGRR